MAKATSTAELKQAFENHLSQTEEHITRLEEVFEVCGFKVQGKKCEAMEGLVEEGKEIIEEHEAGVVRDAALIIAAQKVEHYEIASYGSLRTLAEVMNIPEASQLLQETLDEEAETDELLTQIAMSVNQEAFNGSDQEDEEDSDDEDEEEYEEDDMTEDDEEEYEEDETEEELTSKSRK